ncbi:carbohydrate-binding protein [Streptomyces sp. Isolate_45]|uniref:dioxygenase family protein n=1 Tax=Streptomyces sp. Isolate_45 TaxID=2950111 RepID=UPI002481BD71|nr:carbohydrate-binding protein [Streptomyces sp. Isolate_45]MDA5284854.1 dioxygenase [Streptomyces sp. Isolate_45]
MAGATPLLLGGGAALAGDRGAANGAAPELTPACDDGDEPTVPQTEGPYFKPNSPRRTSLVTASTPGTRLTVSGFVFGRACLPVAGALLDFWQADVNGAYDNSGYGFRGHQFTDAQGAFRLTTIVPGLYPGRTRHVHVKVQAPGRPVLTTQLYFPGEPRNATDSIFDARLLMTVRQAGPAKEGTYDFVLDVPQTPDPTPTPTPTPTATPTGGAWAPGTSYRAGDRVGYGSTAYTCIQAHVAVPGWEPPNVPALWRRS